MKLVRSKGVGVYFCTQNPKDIPDGVVAVGVGIFELIRLHVPQGLVLLGGGLVCLGLCALLYLLMKLLTVGTVKLCKWVWIGIKSLFVGKKTKEETVK